MLFLPNKYSKWYWSIINSARSRVNSRDLYFERHHIIPRSLGGIDENSNLVKLTAREHFICHLLLTKMVTGNAKYKMISAAWATSNLRRRKNQKHLKITSRTYEKLRIAFSKKMSESKKGVPRSLETRVKLSQSHTGKKLTQEHREAISRGGRGRLVSDKTRSKISMIHRGKVYSESTKAKIGAASRGRKSQSKTWKIKDPQGNVFETNRLDRFCIERELSLIAIRRSYKSSPVSRGPSKGWQAIFRSR